MDLKILAERIGLTASATPQEVLDKVYALGDENKTMKQDLEDMRSANERLIAKNEAMRKRDSEVKGLEAALFIDSMVAKQRIKAVERDDMLALYEKSPDVVKRLIDKRRSEDILSREIGFSDDDVPVSAMAEIDGRVAEMRAKEPKLSKSDAQTKVLTEDKDLAERYRLEVVKGAGGAV